jgi:hypothetical protein
VRYVWALREIVCTSGNNDTSINGPLKVDEIQEKNKDAGTTFSDDVQYNGATTNDTNIQTRESVVSLMNGYATKTELQQAINDLRDEIEQQRFQQHPSRCSIR